MKWLFSVRTIIGMVLLFCYTIAADMLEKHLYSGIVFSLVLVFFTVLYLYNVLQAKHSILRNYPIVGYLRYFFESFRPELRQYFFESDLDGKPFNRRQRSIVYQRAKNVRQTVPFGMQVNSLDEGYEWLAHTMFPVHINSSDLRVTVGGKNCKQPYSASILNISAMSYGSLSKTAIQSLNEGAKLGKFAHNTGEGGISPYHLAGGGDLIWQIGTGYFGCRNQDGTFSGELFKEQVAHPNIKMVEIKLSQGAKPGHGGILPAAKNTPEIAAIRKVEPYTTVASPPGHSAFSNMLGLTVFIKQLRELSNGKPIGIKLCVGSKAEFTEMVETMKAENGIGISAVQVGVLKRIIVVSVKKSTTDKELSPEIMVNPKIVSREGFQRMGEGCLSVPGLILPIDRYESIEIEYQSLDGETRRAILQGLESVCFQHELDHLEGIMFVDRGGAGRLRGKLG